MPLNTKLQFLVLCERVVCGTLVCSLSGTSQIPDVATGIFSSCSFEKGYKAYKVLLADFGLPSHSIPCLLFSTFWQYPIYIAYRHVVCCESTFFFAGSSLLDYLLDIYVCLTSNCNVSIQ